MTHAETLYMAAVTAYAVRESRDRLERKLEPPPVYIFFAHRDEHGAPFETMRAAVIACAGYQAIDHWIGHGVAVAALTHACAVAVVAHAHVTPHGDPADAPEVATSVMLSILTMNDGEQLCMGYCFIDEPDGSFSMADPIEMPVKVLDPMMVLPLKPDVVVADSVIASCRRVLEALGSPLWIPLEAITVPAMGAA